MPAMAATKTNSCCIEMKYVSYHVFILMVRKPNHNLRQDRQLIPAFVSFDKLPPSCCLLKQELTNDAIGLTIGK